MTADVESAVLRVQSVLKQLHAELALVTEATDTLTELGDAVTQLHEVARFRAELSRKRDAWLTSFPLRAPVSEMSAADIKAEFHMNYAQCPTCFHVYGPPISSERLSAFLDRMNDLGIG